MAFATMVTNAVEQDLNQLLSYKPPAMIPSGTWPVAEVGDSVGPLVSPIAEERRPLFPIDRVAIFAGRRW